MVWTGPGSLSPARVARTRAEGNPPWRPAGSPCSKGEENGGAERQRQPRVPQCHPPDLLGPDAGVRELERHPDREGQVGEPQARSRTPDLGCFVTSPRLFRLLTVIA